MLSKVFYTWAFRGIVVPIAFFIGAAPCLLSQTLPQSRVVTAHIEDAVTGEALPFVHVIISERESTLSNSEGNFSIVANDGDTLVMRNMGYFTQSIAVSDLPDVVKLIPSSSQLREVTVISLDAILSRVQEQLRRSLKKGRRLYDTYFCRIVEDFGFRVELLEAIVNAKSAVHLRDFSVITGRQSRPDDSIGVRPMLGGMNLHHFLELGPLMSYNAFWNKLVDLPFFEDNLKRLYAYDCSILEEGDGRTVYVLHLKAAFRNVAGRLMRGTAFIDAQNQRLLRFQSVVPTIYMINRFDTITWQTKLMSTFTIEYSYDREGMAEVSYISFDTKGKNVHAEGFMLSTNELNLPKRKKSQRIAENVIASIENAGFDSIMWRHSNFVQRTHREEEIVRWQHLLQPTDSTRRNGQ